MERLVKEINEETEDKLSQLEDLMEKYDIDTIRKFEICIEEYNIAIREKFRYKNLVDKLIKENQDLKSQLKNAIVPKFKVGQEVYFLNRKTLQIEEWKIDYIVILEDYLQYDLVNNGEFKSCDEDELFATKEEVEKKLEELKNE